MSSTVTERVHWAPSGGGYGAGTDRVVDLGWKRQWRSGSRGVAQRV